MIGKTEGTDLRLIFSNILNLCYRSKCQGNQSLCSRKSCRTGSGEGSATVTSNRSNTLTQHGPVIWRFQTLVLPQAIQWQCDIWHICPINPTRNPSFNRVKKMILSFPDVAFLNAVGMVCHRWFIICNNCIFWFWLFRSLQVIHPNSVIYSFIHCPYIIQSVFILSEINFWLYEEAIHDHDLCFSVFI